MNGRILYTHAIMMVIFSLIVNINATDNTNRYVIGFGVEGGIGVMQPHDINTILKARSQTFTDSSELESAIKNVQFQYDVTGYVVWAPLSFLEVKPWFNCRKSLQVTDVKSQANQRFNVAIRSYSPGISAHLRGGNFVAGGGVFLCYADVTWRDSVFSYFDTWQGSNFGYELHAGFEPKRDSHFGMTFMVTYECVRIETLRNKSNRIVYIMPDNRRFTLDLSGVKLGIGLQVSL